MTATTQLSVGKKYRLFYRNPMQRRPREAVMVYLSRQGTSTSWSARPVAGTQEMPDSWLISVTEVDDQEVCYVNRTTPPARRT